MHANQEKTQNTTFHLWNREAEIVESSVEGDKYGEHSSSEITIITSQRNWKILSGE